MVKFEDRLREARESLGWTQETLAGELGISPVSVWNWEQGKKHPSFERLPAIAKALGKSVGWFFDDEPGPGDDARLVRIQRTLDDVLEKISKMVPAAEASPVVFDVDDHGRRYDQMDFDSQTIHRRAARTAPRSPRE